MENVIYSQPPILSGLTEKFKDAFPDVRLFRHFQELVSSLQVSDRKSIAHLNSLSLDHANQSNMNRFLSSGIDGEMIFRINMGLINSTEKDGVLAIDDTILRKWGKNIEAAGWVFDHSVQRYGTWIQQFLSCGSSSRAP